MNQGLTLLGFLWLTCGHVYAAESKCLPDIDISSPPQKPENVSCVNYNWKRLVCRLIYGTYYRSGVISITWEWTVGVTWSKCPNLEINSTEAKCTWSTAQVGDHAFRISITNHMRQADKPVVKTVTVRPPVKPDPVINVTYLANDTYARVSWSHTSGSKNLRFDIQYCSRWDSCQNVESKSRSVTLFHLVPYTEYNVSVVAKPYFNNSVSGFCSNQVNTRFRTQPKVPLYNPKMQPGFYESINDTSIILYWKNIPEMVQYGRIKLYNATSYLLENGTQIMVVPTLFSTIKHASTQQNFLIINELCTTCKYRVELALKNVKGYSLNDSSQLFLLPVIQRPVVKHIDNFKVEALNETYVRIMWLDQKQSYAPTVRSITNYSIVWCRRKNLTDLCKGELQDKVVRKSIKELEVNLEGSFRDYRFGMSVEVQTNKGLLVSSGIVWGTSIPFLKYGVPTDAPPDVETTLTEPSGFNMTWGPYETSSPDHSPAVSYQVTYCSKHNCTAVIITASDNMMQFSVNSLMPGPYNCTVHGVFPGGDGPKSTPSKMVVGSAGNMAASVSGEGDGSMGIIIGAVVGALLLLIVLVLLGVKCKKINHKAYIATKEIEVPEVEKRTSHNNGELQGNSSDSGVVDDGKYSSEDDPTRVALLPQKEDLQIRRGEPCKRPLIQQEDSKGVHSSSVKNIGYKQNASHASHPDTTSGIDSGVSGTDTGQTMDTGQTLNTGQTVLFDQSERDRTLYPSVSSDQSNDQSGNQDDGYRRPTFADSSVDSQYDPIDNYDLSKVSVESYTQPTIA
ncbi:uncharacterized protein LOC110461989 isoform X2 [Mizuhopecten yessoensis]|uniref:uncharacterized protein LOC110461989 isoform X2 n=1 Tax=Mizuhopecten yessoensis TaxID=6573 RepID=UPI000B458DD8|nr:uncharacterized protein LOC110461989 isoform X2 [Mizuhopecten yessoensis]